MNDTEIQNRIVDIFKSHHLKTTPQRLAVYRELLRSKDHPTVDSLYQVVRREHPGISFDTVNRTLATFVEVGIVDNIEGLGSQRRFDADTGSHHHLHCAGCGRIIDFYEKSLDDIEIPGNISEKYEVISKRVVVKIMCDMCLKQK